MNSLFSQQPIFQDPQSQLSNIQAPPVQLPGSQVQLAQSQPTSPMQKPAAQFWTHDPQGQYAQHDNMMQLTNALHTAFNMPEAKAFQKAIPGVNWSSVADNISQHQEDLKNSEPNLGYIGNHGVVSATTAAASGGSYMDVAAGMLGKQEGKDHQVLSEFFKKTGVGSIDPTVTPWCAAYANAVLQAGGIKGTGSLAARSFLKWGQEVNRGDASKGDVVVLSRGNNKTQGHVGFVDHISSDGKTVYVLAGNQGDSVSVRPFPANKVLGYRRPPSGDEIKVAMNSRANPPQPSVPVPGVTPNIHAFDKNVPVRDLSPQEIDAIMRFNSK